MRSIPPPDVSIITPLFNKGKYIEDTILSVLGQSLSSWELLVIDNGSADDGPQLVSAFESRDRRVRLLSSSKRGPGVARNTGLQQAAGRWCLFLDADDLLESTHLATLVEAANSHPGYKIVAGGWAEFSDGNSPEHAEKRNARQDGDALRFTSIAYAPWPISAAIIQREVLTGPLRWHEELDNSIGEDVSFWFRLLQTYRPLIVGGNGFLYRRFAHNSRTDSCDLSGWLEGISRQLDANVSYLQHHRLDLEWRHAENLMRTYLSIWTRAQTARDHQVAERALVRARRWHRHCLRLGGWRHPFLLARYALGPRVTDKLSTVLQWLSVMPNSQSAQ
jgi:glycosyltransferase involved in cell wall biosynthesis